MCKLELVLLPASRTTWRWCLEIWYLEIVEVSGKLVMVEVVVVPGDDCLWWLWCGGGGGGVYVYNGVELYRCYSV